MNRYLSTVIMVALLLGIGFDGVLALDAAPNNLEVRQEEFTLKSRMRPVLVDVLKEQYIGLSVNVRYVLQHDPIVSSQANVKRMKLPGFGSQMTITNGPGDISGYIDKYIRYRTVVLVVRNRLSDSVEESIARLLKEQGELDIGGRDAFSFLVAAEEQVAPEEPLDEGNGENGKQRKEKTDQLVKKIGKERQETKQRLAQLFPELEQPIEPVDARKEAESSKHLILSRKAYHNNDLNVALNEVIEAININPYAAKSYEMLGSIYYRLKWNNLALNNWEKALALDPDNRKLSRFIAKVKNEL